MSSVQKSLCSKGWLDLAFDDGDYSRKWVILDNGVLWVYRFNLDGNGAEQVLPLHDAEVQFPSSSPQASAGPQVVDVLLGSGSHAKRVRLRTDSDEEYRRWTSAMMEAAQLWHSRRQMALLAVVPGAAAGLGQRPGVSPVTPPSGLVEARRLLVQELSHFLVQVGELRTRTRRAVTRNQDHEDAKDLPRFLRRAIADAVDKIWRTCGRAFACADVPDRGGGGSRENADPLVVYDAVLILREAVDAFVTYCSLLRDLQAMLRDAEPQTEDPVPFTPLRCLSALRDTLSALAPLINVPEEEARQRAALAAVDSILQRCWTELSKRPMEHDMTMATCSPSKATGGDRSSSRSSTSSVTTCVPFIGSPSVRRLASRLQRDVVRTSVRRARKRARTEGLALLPDQQLDDSLDKDDAAESLEMTVLEPLSAATSDSSDQDDAPAPEVGPRTPSGAAQPSLQRLAMSVGRSLSSNVNVSSPSNTLRRGWQDPALLRRRRLVSSWTDSEGSTPSDDADDVFVRPANPGHLRTENGQVKVRNEDQDSMDWEEEDESAGRLPSFEGDVLDVPVTPATPNGGGRRALWCETQEVQRSGLLDRLNSSESALQEAKFEVLSSEESYLRSLDVLAHRLQSIEALQDPCVISDQDRDAVSKFLDTARACSMRFVSALRALWSLDMMMRGLCTLVHKESMPGASLQQYVLIVSLQPRAASVLSKIGSLEASQLIPLLSLPAQRASRLPLLLGAILRRLDQRTSEAVICRAALDRLNQIVFECNESLRRAEQTERMAELGKMLRAEKTSSKRSSWNERKNNVIGRAKSFFLKSNRFGTKTSKILTSTSSMLHLT